jgi:hypothetical protein
MRIKTDKQGDVAPNTRPFQYARNMPIFGAILLLLLMSILIAGCGVNNSTTAQTSTDAPQPTTTIHFNTANLSPTPTLPPNWCGIWVVNASPYYSASGVVTVYAKFTSNNNGNPVGIAGATVNLTVQWGDLSTPPVSPVQTSSTGLATITLPMGSHYAAINKLSLITAQFTGGGQSCSVDQTRAASFTLIQGAAPTKKGTTTVTTGGTPGGGRKKN